MKSVLALTALASLAALPKPASAANCADLKQVALPKTTITLAESVSAGAFTPPVPAPASRVPSIGRPEPRRAQREVESEPADHSHLPAFLLRPVRARV